MIRMLKVWNGYQPDQIVTFSSVEEARLISLGYASADLDGAADAEFLVKGKADPVTGGVGLSIGKNKFGLLGFAPPTPDFAGIIAAVKAAIASPTAKNVLFDDVLYDLGANYIPVVSGIGYIGEEIRFKYQNGGWTDAAPFPIGGSRFKSTAAAVFWDGAEDLAAVTATVAAQDAVFVAGSSDITVTNGAAFTLGNRVYATSSACGFYAGIGYYVVYKSGNVIRLALPDGVGTTYSAFSPIVATDGATKTAFISAGLPNDSCTGVTIRNLIGIEVNTMLKAGAKKTFSFVYSDISDIYATGVVANQGTRNAARLIDVVNFAQCDIQRIFTWDGDGQYYGSNYPQATFLPGNTKFSHIFDSTNAKTMSNGPGGQCLVNHGIIFQAESDSILNEIHADCLQNNRGVTNLARTAQTDAAASINGTASLTVTDGTLWRPGLPFTFNTIAGSNNIYANVVYYVTSQVGNVLTFSNKKGDTNIVPSGTGTVSISTWGFPAIEIGGVGTNPQIASSSFTGMDLEGHSSAQLSLQYIYKSDINPIQCSGIVARQVGNTTLRCTDLPETDFDFACSILYVGNRKVTATTPNWKTFTGAGLSRWSDSTAGHTQDVWALSLHDGKYNTAQQLTPKQRGLEGISYGAFQFIRANVPVCAAQYAIDSSITLSNSVYVGAIVFNGAAGQTFTLPTIVDVDTTQTMVGYTFELINASANALAIATNGTQLVNNIAAKTTTSLVANARCRVTACKTAGGALFWAIHVEAPAP